MPDVPPNDVSPPPGDSAPVLLLVDDDDHTASALLRVLQETVPRLQVRRCPGLTEAEALLREARIDVVLAKHELPDGTSLDLMATCDEAGREVPFVVQGDTERAETVVAVMKAGAHDFIYRDPAGAYLRRLPYVLLEALQSEPDGREDVVVRLHRQQEAWWEQVRRLLAHVSHEIKNPLSIISGNAQLLLELARYSDLDPDLLHPIQDIEEASRRVADSLQKLNEIRSLSAAEIRQQGTDRLLRFR